MKVWKTGSKFANLIATMGQIIGCELHALWYEGTTDSRVPIIGVRIISSSDSAMA